MNINKKKPSVGIGDQATSLWSQGNKMTQSITDGLLSLVVLIFEEEIKQYYPYQGLYERLHMGVKTGYYDFIKKR